MNSEKTYIPLVENYGNRPVTLDPIQQKLEPHVGAMITFWVCVWVITACVVLYRLYREYRER
jgi:hypothetical protein